MANMVHSNLPVFDGKDYDDWCVKMEAILGYQEVDEIVKQGVKELKEDDTAAAKKLQKEERRLDCKARMLLHQCVSPTIFQKISKASSAKEAWDILQEGYGNTGKVKKVRLQALQRQYELLGMGTKETVIEYMGRIQNLINDMRACGKIVKDRKLIEKVLRTLTPQYDHIVITIEECKDLDSLKIEELQNSLVAHEQRLLERKNAEKAAEIQATEQALQARTKQNYKNRGRGRGRSRGRGGRSGGRNTTYSDQNDEENGEDEGSRGGRCPRGRGRKGTDKRNIQCYICKKYGHYSYDCWHNESATKGKSDDTANLAQDAHDCESELVVLMGVASEIRKMDKDLMSKDMCWKNVDYTLPMDNMTRLIDSGEIKSSCCQSGERQHADAKIKERCVMLTNYNQEHVENDQSWYLDTGCSNHMTGRREWLVELDSSRKSKIRFADDSMVMAEGVGKVLLTCKNGETAYMDEVLFVPSMKSNLLSLGQLLEKGYSMIMRDNSIEVFDKKHRLIIKAPIAKNRTFKVNLNASTI
ncbi:uncharacterized protein LOC108339076 [Vigna angularis]|uniref:uncharacterized protein LOC108339076 n=1 Tax=Phaseolus angularis TaxID=3914 RepID=UPI000809CBAB|nr:uncharacterized protein LOC108339076 [Vigna angularis]